MPAPVRFAVVGLRHYHIVSIVKAIQQRPDTQCVAICEQDPAARKQAEKDTPLTITHSSFERMLADVECDAVAVGAAYGDRGKLIQRILESGRHVISDKPVCTRLEELDAIEKLIDRTGLSLGCQLDLRDAAPLRTLRRLIHENQIGEVHTVTCLAQHPLNRQARPAWYFEPDLHGGTINDILIHAFDAIPWITGRRITNVVAARVWNARAEVPTFQDGAQVMLQLDNAGGVLADASYLAPEAAAYTSPQYWRFTVHAGAGMAETSLNADSVILTRAGDKTARAIPLDPANPAGYLDDFLHEVAGSPRADGVTTAGVLSASRIALTAQAYADRNFQPAAS